MKLPLVSVVMATRNRAHLLPRSIGSVLQQTYSNLELVIVDDGSEDATRAAVLAFQDPRISYRHLDSSSGVSAARNAGIRMATGTLIAFQDDDDEWFPDKVAKQVKALSDAANGVGLNLCGHISAYSNGEVYVGGPGYFANVQPEAGYGNLALIATPGWLVRREPLIAAGLFDERLQTLEDWELALRLSDHCSFTHLDEPLYRKARVGDDRLSKNQRQLARALQIIIPRHAGRWAGNPAVTSRHYLLLGREQAQHGDLGEARRLLWRSIRCRPFRVRTWLLLVATLLGRTAVRSLIRLQALVRSRATDGAGSA